MMRLIIIFMLVICAASYAEARPVIADLSLRQIDIDSGFKGTEILLFGARNDAGDVVVVVRGPEISYVLRKKERIAAVWVNRQQAVFQDAYGFYTVASSRPLEELKNDHLMKELGIGVDNLDTPIEAEGDSNPAEFQQAFLDKQTKGHLYLPTIGKVSFIGDTLFRTIIKFPENIPRGVYTADVYLFTEGQLSGVQSTPLIVKKQGFDALVFDFSYQHPAIYGILSVLIALSAGWAAGAIFRKV